VVIVGERGSGCSLAARCVHDLSSRSAGPFVTLDLAGLGPDAVEHRLLISGGGLSRADDAEGGSLVLDHVGGISPDVWKTAVSILADRSGVPPRMMLIANPDSDRQGERSWLAGLSGEQVTVPPLRQRGGDIPLLLNAMVDDCAAEGGPVALTNAAVAALAGYDWPGNVVELKNEIRRALAAAGPDSVIDIEHLSEPVSADRQDSPGPVAELDRLSELSLAEARSRFEAWMIRKALAATSGNQTEAAQRLGMSRAGLFKKIRKLDL
jgi:two-component system nitrogen regulation response regulator NtrX